MPVVYLSAIGLVALSVIPFMAGWLAIDIGSNSVRLLVGLPAVLCGAALFLIGCIRVAVAPFIKVN